MVVSEQELLNPEEQDAVLQDIALVLAHNLPPGWQECLAVYGAVGEHAETTVRIERLNGPPADLAGPEVLGELFGRLRTGMYRPGVGTWFSARFRLTHPVDYRVEYDNTEQPEWSTAPPAEAYADELRTFPRDPEHVPGWLRGTAGVVADANVPDVDEAADAHADAAPPRFQMARLFDSLGPGETPQVNRPTVPDDEVEAVADYLTKAPMVLAARSLDNDLLHPARPAKVPLSYLTDGTWIWPGGVGYYLRTHGVPPEPELVEHIRRQGFQPPEVDEYTREVAVAAIMGQAPPPPPALAAPADEGVSHKPAEPEKPAPEAAEPGLATSALATPAPAEPAQVEPVPVESASVGPAQVGSAPDASAHDEGGPVGAAPVAPTPAEPIHLEPSLAEPVPDEPVPDEPTPAEPTPAGPAHAGPASAGPVQAEPAAGEPASPFGPAAGERTPDVPAPQEAAPFTASPAESAPPAAPPAAPSQDDGDVRALERLRARLTELDVDPESYGIEMIVDDAWCLVREDVGWTVFRSVGGDRAVSVAFPAADQAAAFMLGSLLMTADLPRRPAAVPPPATRPDLGRPARTYDGPIEPLPGEPPVTLFRNLREFELVAGTEIDRVGDPAGNLTYAAGTHYSQRSLPQEWADRPYRVYRLRQPLRVLIGTAVPWFEQPGGGTGYFLPVSVAELLADGVLTEI